MTSLITPSRTRTRRLAERTQILMDVANREGGLVVGTGDLSELALGWATYNADHMSMYGVNAGVPKTLVRHLVHYVADEARAKGDEGLAAVLLDVLDTPVSPELLPATEGGKDLAKRPKTLLVPMSCTISSCIRYCAVDLHRKRCIDWRLPLLMGAMRAALMPMAPALVPMMPRPS